MERKIFERWGMIFNENIVFYSPKVQELRIGVDHNVIFENKFNSSLL